MGHSEVFGCGIYVERTLVSLRIHTYLTHILHLMVSNQMPNSWLQKAQDAKAFSSANNMSFSIEAKQNKTKSSSLRQMRKRGMNVCRLLSYTEGSEERNCLFCSGKVEFHALRLEFFDQKKPQYKTGMKNFEQDRH